MSDDLKLNKKQAALVGDVLGTLLGKLGVPAETCTAVEAMIKAMAPSDVHQTTAIGNDKPGKKKKPLAFTGESDGDDDTTGEKNEEEDAGGVAKSFEFDIDVAKLDPDQQMIFGWASVSSVDGKDIIDKQDDIVPIEELEKAAYDFCLFSREHGDMHTKRGTGRLIESFVFTPEKAKCGIVAKNDQGQQIFGWWAGFKVESPEVWASHKRGERPEFSIAGRATSTDQV